MTDLLKRVEFVIVPVVNPDGYYVRTLAASIVVLLIVGGTHSLPAADMAAVPQISLLEEEPGQAVHQS